GVFRIIDCFEVLDSVLGIVRENDFERIENGHAAFRDSVEMIANAVFEQGNVGDAVEFGDANGSAEIANSFRSVTAATKTGDGGHARIIPAGDEVFRDELEELALAHDGVAEVQAGELGLLRVATRFEAIEEPIVERAVDFELERAERVRDA